MIGRFVGRYEFLSNFSPSPIEASGLVYPTVEHYFQAHKSLNPADRRRIAEAATPSAAKYLGRSVVLRDDWEGVKFGVMRSGLALKFITGTPLALKLIATDDELLQEGNTWGDRFWGVVDGAGHNWLGHLLMARRAELRGL